MPPVSSPRKSITSLLFKQYPGQQQVDLACKINVPGSWFGGTSDGALTAGERREKYIAVAVEYNEKHVFEAAARGRKAVVFPAIRFVCPSDAADDPDHHGFWMKLTDWNRYRNDTYKGDREAEVCAVHPCLPTSARHAPPCARI